MGGYQELTWIGCTDAAAEHSWRWIATGKPCGRQDGIGEAAYSNWRGGQPDKSTPAEKCAMLWSWEGGMQWADYDCGQGTYNARTVHFVCEAPANVEVVKAPLGSNLALLIANATTAAGGAEGGRGGSSSTRIYLQPGRYMYSADLDTVEGTRVSVYGVGTLSDTAAKEELDALVRAQCDCSGCYIDGSTGECRRSTEGGDVAFATTVDTTTDITTLSFASNGISKCTVGCINAAASGDSVASQCMSNCWATSVDSIMWFTRPAAIAPTAGFSAWKDAVDATAGAGGGGEYQLFDVQASSRVAAECRRFGTTHNTYAEHFNHGCTLATQSVSTCFDKCRAHSSAQSTADQNTHQTDYASACTAACIWSFVAAGVETLGVDSSSVKPWGVLKPQCHSVCAELAELLAKEGCKETCAAALSDTPVLLHKDHGDYVSPFKDGVFGGSSGVTQVAYAAKYCTSQFGTWDAARDTATVLAKHPGCIVAASWLAFKALEQAHCTTAKGAHMCSGGASASASILSIRKTLSITGSGTSLTFHNVVVDTDGALLQNSADPLVEVLGGGEFRAVNCAFRTVRSWQNANPFQIVGSNTDVSKMVASSCIYRSTAPTDDTSLVETVRAEGNSLLLSCMEEHPSVSKTAATAHVVRKDTECDATSSARRWRWDASVLRSESIVASTATCVVPGLIKLREQFRGFQLEEAGTGSALSLSDRGLPMVHLASDKHSDAIAFPFARDETFGANGGHIFLVGKFSRIPAEVISESFTLRRDRYTFVNSPRTWTDARRDCRSRGMDLVSIETEQEMQLIKSLVAQELGLDLETDEGQSRGYARSFCKVGAAAWTGCHRDDRGQWVWEGTGQSCGNGGSSAWNSVDKSENEYCIHLWFCKKEWATHYCSSGTVESYICEDNSIPEGTYDYVTEDGTEVFMCGAGDEASACYCDGTVYYGKRYVVGNSGVRASYSQMMQAPTGNIQVKGEWPCTQYVETIPIPIPPAFLIEPAREHLRWAPLSMTPLVGTLLLSQPC